MKEALNQQDPKRKKGRTRTPFFCHPIPQLCVNLVAFGGHDEIVFVQAFDDMRPPGYGDFTPLGQQGGMVVFFFCDFPDLIGELQGLGEVFEFEFTSKTLDPFDLDDFPLRDLGL
jgi:hypothetical protein